MAGLQVVNVLQLTPTHNLPVHSSGLATIFGASHAMDKAGNSSFQYKAPTQPKKQKKSVSQAQDH